MPFQSGRIFAETLLRMEQGEAPANFYIRFPPAGKVLMHPSAAIFAALDGPISRAPCAHSSAYSPSNKDRRCGV